MKRIATAAAVLAALPGLAAAQAQYVPGVWRCVHNSVPVNIDLMVQANPDYSLYAEGTYLMNASAAMNQPIFHQIRAYGRWGVVSDPGVPGVPVVQFQILPGNVASFSLFPAWIGDPNALYARALDPANNATSETACQRLR